MIVHRTSTVFRLLLRTPAWVCIIMQARVQNDTRNFFEISRPYWMPGSKF